MLNGDDFVFETHPDGVRCVHKVTKKGFGEYFQSQCRDVEWQCALVVYEKYKRKHGLTNEVLFRLREFAEGFSRERKAAGKPLHKEFLTQACSAELKNGSMR